MTELLAFRPVSTAFEKARKLLLEPFDIWLWVKLVIITFFAASSSGTFNPGNSIQYNLDRADVSRLPYQDPGSYLSDATLVALVVLIVLAAIALALLMSYLRGVFAFVLIDALTTGNARIVRSFKENMGRGFKVFLFNVAVAIVSIVVIGAFVIALMLAILWAVGGSQPAGVGDKVSPWALLALIAVVLVGIVVMVAFSVAVGLVVGFVYDFAVPLMYFRDMGLRQAIGHVWGLVRRQPLQFIAYVVVRWLLEVAIAIVTGVALLFILAVFIAMGVIVFVAMLGAAQASLMFAVLLGLVLLAGLLLLIAMIASISMPAQVYLRYYSLDFLRSLDPSYVKYAARFG